MTPAFDAAKFDAVVLTGGKGRRMGGTDKASLVVGGRSFAERVAAAVEGAERLIVVGPRPVPGGFPARAISTCESPPGGGPVAGLAAALEHVTAPEVAVLAVDLPFVTAEAIDTLRVARTIGTAAVIPVDGEGIDQPLCSVWSSEALRAALAALGPGPAGQSMRALVAAAEPVVRFDGLWDAWFDCDTPADLRSGREKGVSDPQLRDSERGGR